MWEYFIEKDNRIIRPLDGTEFILNNFYINVVDVFPKFSIEEFKKNAQEELSKVEIFNIATKTIDDHIFYIKKPFQIHVEEEVEENNDVNICFLFKICQLKNDKTKLTFSVLHALCDGRTIFDLLDLVRKVINGEKLEKMDTPVCPFGHKDNFRDVDKFFTNGIPQLYKDIQEANLLPYLPEPFENVNVFRIYDYHPIKEFCTENKVGVQSLLMAAFSRATRKFNNLPKETPLWCHVPSDTRSSPLATEEHKNRKFYSNVGVFYVKIIGQNTLMEDIQHCMSQLREYQKRNEDVIQVVSTGQTLDKETLQYKPLVTFPGFQTHAVIATSHIGKVNGNNPFFYVNTVPFFGQYDFLNYAYHTDDKLYVSSYRPINFDKTFIKYINEELDNVFKL
ncbi:hypothetical protein PIROE2DRAFT_1706 [Piromyces sp. E2]|nr:hypothetical protein PIROE2DRAFT_1706 [Piromyces sp. E2]|eukprot:OUM70282.1 hypothetical protein PIROE2DRAFT_1706 [Piromyces sp. E2]